MNQTNPKHLNGPRMTAKDANENDKLVSRKVKIKNTLRGGDPNDVNPSNEKHLIEQAFFSPKI